MDNITNLLPPDWPDFVKNSDPDFLGKDTLMVAIKQWSKRRTNLSSGIKYQLERLKSMSNPSKIKLAVKRLRDDPNNITITPKGFHYASSPESIFPFSIARDARLYAKTTMSYCGGCSYCETITYKHNDPIESSLKCNFLKNTSFANRTNKPYSNCLFQTFELQQFKKVICAHKLVIEKQIEEVSEILEKINALSSIIKSVPERPVIPHLRGVEYFKEGENVYAYIGNWRDYFPEYQNRAFFPCIVLDNNSLKVLFQQKVHSRNDNLEGYGGFILHREWSLISQENLKALLADPEYAAYWSKMASRCDDRIDPEKFLAALEKLRSEN